jgi:hypothetical protein
VLGCTSGDGEDLPAAARLLAEGDLDQPDRRPRRDVDAKRAALPGFAEEQAALAPAAAPKLRAIEGNPDAPGRKPEGKPKFRVIDGK